MSELAHIAGLILSACFAWAAIAKLARPARWRTSLRPYASAPVARRLARAVPVAELAVAALLLADLRAGAILAVALLALFSAAIVRARRTAGERLPCACFGGRRERDWRSLVARNAVLALLAAPAIATGGGSALDQGLPPAADLTAAALAAAGLALTAWTVAATRTAFRR